jgi:hypothetical protein
MDSFKKYVDKNKKGALHVFDIDDTLFRTTAKIHVKNKNGETVHKLSNSEFNDHHLPAGHHYDFDEFASSEKFHDESKPIPKMLNKLKAIHSNITNKPNSNSKVIMNTARADFDDKDKFLDTFRKHGVDIDNIHVHRAGNIPGDELPAKKKVTIIKKYLQDNPLGSVHMYDDSKTNLNHFVNMKNDHPDVDFHAWHVKEDGSIKKFKPESK